MSHQLKIETKRPIGPRERAAWRSLGCQLDCTVQFERSANAGLRISLGPYSLEAPAYDGLDRLKVQRIQFSDLTLQGLAGAPVNVVPERNGSHHVFSADIFSAAMQFSVLMAEDDIQERAEDGTISAFSLQLFRNTPTVLLSDLTRDAARILSQVMQCPLAELHPGGAPFSVVFSCDVDGAYSGLDQVSSLMSLLDEHEVVLPTFMLMTETNDEKTFYDPIYCSHEDWVQSLISRNIECGLHSSFGAMLDRKMLADQKRRVEEIWGQPVVSHRAHYLRYRHPVTTGYLSDLGILYDCSLGYYNSSANRNGSSLPIYFADPAGRNRGVWSLPLTILDQHLFMGVPDGLPGWVTSDGSIDLDGRTRLFELIDQTADRGGVITLDWHLHSIAHEHTPYHREALSAILAYARAKGAWLGGVAAFHERFEALYSKHIAASEAIAFSSNAKPIAAEEERHYAEKMSHAVVNVAEYVDATASTVRAVMPESAERIVDVGCGHGWVSQRIAPFHRVLCMDLTAEIMSHVTRPKSIGSILEMPLEDKSVEMVMASDVIEHLSVEERRKAMAEIDRVARDFIYLQVPHDEALPVSTIGCPECGGNWHVNFHKDSFTAQTLIDELGFGWKPTAITYTGNLNVVDQTAKEILDSRDRNCTPLGFPGVHSCPFCAHDFELAGEQVGTKHDYLYQQTLSSRVKKPLQASEVGVLFVRKGAEPCEWVNEGEAILLGKNGTRRSLPAPMCIPDNMIDFRLKNVAINTIVGAIHRTLFAYACTQNCVLQETPSGAVPVSYDVDEQSTLSLSFPRPGGASKLTLEVHALGPAKISLQGYTADNKCVLVEARDIVCGTALVEVDLPEETPVFTYSVTISPTLTLRRAFLDNEPHQYYAYDLGKNWYLGHIVWKTQGITYFLIVPASGVVQVSRPVTELTLDDFSIQAL